MQLLGAVCMEGQSFSSGFPLAKLQANVIVSHDNQFRFADELPPAIFGGQS
jgi:hypothetical protein